MFDAFVDQWLNPYCRQFSHLCPTKVDEVLEMIIHRFFTDITSQNPDWRVIDIQ